MRYKCFVDLDGVLVDFIKAAFALHNFPIPDPWPRYTTGEYKNELIWNPEDVVGISAAEFWKPIDDTFWATLEWTAESKRILELCENTFGRNNVCILSSPPRDPSGQVGKMAWIKQHMPFYYRQFLLGPKKEFVAGPGKILIDDSPGNVEKFDDEGGYGVLVPRPWNRLGNLSPDLTVESIILQLKEALYSV